MVPRCFDGNLVESKLFDGILQNADLKAGEPFLLHPPEFLLE